MVMGQHQLAQCLDRFGDTVSGALVGGDGVERLGTDDARDGDAAGADIHEAGRTEERIAGLGVHGVRAHRDAMEVGLEVVDPAVVARGDGVVEADQDVPFDAALSEPVVARALEEVPQSTTRLSCLLACRCVSIGTAPSKAEWKSVVAMIRRRCLAAVMG